MRWRSVNKRLLESGKVFTTENPDGSTSIIGNWFTYANLTLSTALFGFTFLIACIATAAYYTLVVVTEPSQQRSLRSTKPIQRTPVGTLPEWNFERILRLLYFAYTTYSTLDLDNNDCQNKIICEFQEQKGMIGKATRRISSFLLFLNIFDTFPYIKEYQEAVRRGQRRSDDENDIGNTTSGTNNQKHLNESCESYYASCAFSIEKFNLQYNGIFSTTRVSSS